jgi:hypothetical protein
MIAYLDTNVFDHLYRKAGCTSADIANLRKAIYGRDLSIRLSIHTLEEILLAPRATPQAFAAQIKLTLSIANSRALIKPCDQLLIDDIRAYAARGEPDRPFVRGAMQNAVAAGIAALIESDGEEIEDEFLAALEEAKKQKAQLRDIIVAARTGIDSAAGPYERPSFEEYWKTRAAGAAEGLARSAGVVEECARRGIEGLLDVKSVRMAAGAVLSAAYASAFEHEEDQAIERLDVHHPIAAAAVAETFVTDDVRLRVSPARVPMRDFAVMNLQEFLQRLA